LIRKESGLTLIEVLLSLSILSLVGLVIWNTFVDGVSYSRKALSKNAIQQEAAIISMNLTKIHQNSDEYKILSSDCIVKVLHQSEGISSTKEFSHPNLCISSNETNGVLIPSITDFELDLTIYDTEHPSQKIKLETTLYRLKEEENDAL
jgi:type II secretory pathway pseudopilin PulG